MLNIEELFELVKSVSSGELVVDHNSTPKSIIVAKADLLKVCSELHRHPTAFFDSLSCITGIDNGPATGTMEVVYNLYSIPFNHHLALKVVVPREEPEIDTVSSIWRTANWHEREVFDLFGIRFNGHPDLRRILLPADWEGHPLRKDYKQQDTYRSIRIEY
jgi:NADH-quinone oxidoreductase subunit C